jgi:hypothetical protein
MSKDADDAFVVLLPKIKKLEARYEKINAEDPIARGRIGKKILKLVDTAELSTEYLRHCEQQVESDLIEPTRSRVESMIRIINARGATYY